MYQLPLLQKKFRTDDAGSVGIMFAAAVIAIAFTIGMAVDLGRASSVSSKMKMGLDAAALAAAKAMNEDDSLTVSEVQQLAENYFIAQMSANGISSGQFRNFNAAVDSVNFTVAASVLADVPTTFTRVLNHDNITVASSSTATFRLKRVELALMLDITGSMDGTKIADLKVAAESVIDVLLPNNKPHKNRIALIPYAASINAGSYAGDASDGLSVDDCVIERTGAEAYTDAAPGVGSFFEVMADPANPTNGNYGCPASSIIPLTRDRSTLINAMQALNASGATAGHLGTAWAWYTLSPNWSAVWPDSSRPKAYDDDDVIKAVILMTDGSYNTSYHNGAANAASTEQAIELCNRMKDAAVGIRVFSVAFQAPVDAEATLRDCASGVGDYFDATDGDALKSAFKNIAEKLIAIRLAK